jgi:hypothetical protein
MRAVQIAIVLAAVGVLLCLWMLLGVAWYNFIAFMMVAQPLLLLAIVIFVGVAVRDLRRKGVL